MAHPDLDRLLEFCIPFAQQMLKKNGEFYPFAASIESDGELHPLAIDDGNEKPLSSEMIDQFIALFRSLAPQGNLQAIAICYDGRVTLEGKDKQDAVSVFLEHSNGESITVYLPYQKRLFRGYVYDSLVATQAAPRVFMP